MSFVQKALDTQGRDIFLFDDFFNHKNDFDPHSNEEIFPEATNLREINASFSSAGFRPMVRSIKRPRTHRRSIGKGKPSITEVRSNGWRGRKWNCLSSHRKNII